MADPFADPPTERWRRRERFTEYPETVEGDISRAFVEFVLHVHPDVPYPSATAALMCRQAYDLGLREGSQRSATVIPFRRESAHLHPQSYQQLRQLIKLHGSSLIRRALEEIAQNG